MNKLFFLTLFLLSAVCYGQEICDNGIDDDGDGLIDLNDDDCDCDGDIVIESLIPNHSFEDHSCCPMTYSMLTCADTWIQASSATSDYYNTCGIDGPEDVVPEIINPEFPLPGGGNGYAAFISQSSFGSEYNEYIGACLLGPMEAGVTYILNMWVARSVGEEDLELTIYGTPDCGDMPWGGNQCPIGVGSWEVLAETDIALTTATVWQEVTMTFIPSVDINAIAIGGACGLTPVPPGEPYNYYYVDELTLLDSDSYYGLDHTGGWCTGDLLLTAETDTIGGIWQWYKDGIALVGETSEDLIAIPYGEGEFTAMYTIGEYCNRLTYFSPEIDIEADFLHETFCFPGISTFTNTSTYDDIEAVFFTWDFGDGATSTLESPTHTYAGSGEYDVSLIVHSVDSTCNDTLAITYVVAATPTAEIDFSALGMFTWAGHEVVCMNNVVDFVDASTVDAPSSITGWEWVFGDGGTSTEESPSYPYIDYGIFDITLIVETEAGCKDTVVYEELYVTALFPEFTVDNECVFDDVDFINTSTIIAPSTFDEWEWDFGDGGTGSIEDMTHVYSAPGIYTVELISTSESGCKDTIEHIVEIYPQPVVDFEFIVDGASSEDGSTGGCFFSEVFFVDLTTITGTSDLTSWAWDFGDGGTSTLEDPSHFYAAEGTYTVTLTVESEYGCNHTYSMDIIMNTVVLIVSSDTTICQNGVATIYGWGPDGEVYIYDWSIPGADNSDTQVITDLVDDYTVYVTATSAAGCVSDLDSIQITLLDPITLTISLPDTTCIDQNYSATVVASGGDGAYNYSWTANGVPIADITATINTSPAVYTEYCVTVTDGCETDPVSICTQTYIPEMVVFTADTTEGCEPLTIVFTDLTGPNVSLNTSTWHFEGETYVGNPISHTFNNAGSYNVTLDVLSPSGCVTSLTKENYITVHPKPDPLFYVTPNPTTYFNTVVKLVNINPNITSDYEWKMPNASPNSAYGVTSVEVVYPELVSGNYTTTLIETTEYGCIDSTSIIVVVTNEQIIYVPNTFTPDGDNVNNTWKVHIEGIDIYDYHLTLFNRWGEIVWESYDKSAEWTGAYKGELVEDGTYVWVISAKDQENDKVYEFRGTVNVLK